MIRFIIVRIVGAIVVLWIVSVLTFLIFQLAPTLSHTNPVYYFIGKVPFKPGSVQLKLLEHRFGFDLPIWQQYWHWLSGILFGQSISDGTSAPIACAAPCFGYSFRQNELVGHLIVQAIPVSLSLCIGAAVLWVIGGVTVGTVSALRPRSWFDRVGMGGSLVAVSLPIFFTGPLALLIFSAWLKWLPNIQYVPITQNVGQWFLGMILPWLCLAFSFAALYARLTRSNMLETMGEDFIRTARAKGLSPATVVVRHGLRAALTPIVTIFGIDFGTLIGSTVITETVFNFRGLGWLTIQSISTQDLPVILGVTLIASFVLVIANFVVDVLYSAIDPRVRL